MLSSVTSWWGGQPSEQEASEVEQKNTEQENASKEATTDVPLTTDQESPTAKSGDDTEEPSGPEPTQAGPSVQEQLDEVSAKAYDAAKEWGSKYRSS